MKVTPILVLICSALLIHSHVISAESENLPETSLTQEELSQCSLCACMIPASEQTTRGPLLCNCHSHEGQGRWSGCMCDHEAQQDQGCLGCMRCHLNTDAELIECEECIHPSQQQTRSVNTQDTISCSMCACMVPAPENITRGPVVCGCHSREGNRWSGCMCDSSAQASYDCASCAPALENTDDQACNCAAMHGKKKANHESE